MILAIEAGVEGGSISLSSAGNAVASWAGDSNVSRAEDLLPAIATMMAETGISTSDISMIAVAVGPGSFTGIRIGLSTGFGLATGLGIQMTSVSVLRAMATAVSGPPAVVAAVPMGRSSICVQRFAKGSPISEPQTLQELEFEDLIGGTSETILVHEALAAPSERAKNLVNLGRDLAKLVGAFAATHPEHNEDPLFIAKSF